MIKIILIIVIVLSSAVVTKHPRMKYVFSTCDMAAKFEAMLHEVGCGGWGVNMAGRNDANVPWVWSHGRCYARLRGVGRCKSCKGCGSVSGLFLVVLGLSRFVSSQTLKTVANGRFSSSFLFSLCFISKKYIWIVIVMSLFCVCARVFCLALCVFCVCVLSWCVFSLYVFHVCVTAFSSCGFKLLNSGD